MFTPRQASELLQIPDSSLRRYANLVRDFLSSHANQRKRLYTQDDLDIIARVRDLTAQGVKLEEVTGHLNQVIDRGEKRENTALALPGLLTRMDDLQAALQQAREAQDRRIDELQGKVDQLAQELENERKERNRSWVDRFFKRKR